MATPKPRANPPRPSSDPSTNIPLNPPDPSIEEQLRTMAGYRPPEDQGTLFDADDVGDLGTLSRKDIDEGELGADNADRPEDVENLELLTELELRDGETDDPMEAVEEGMTYVPPIDPPTVPSASLEDAEVASGLGGSSLDDPYDADHHGDFLPGDDEMSARVREALRADSSTTQYAGRLAIETRGGVVTVRGQVDDLVDSDNILAVAEYVAGVEEVIDELRVRGLE